MPCRLYLTAIFFPLLLVLLLDVHLHKGQFRKFDCSCKVKWLGGTSLVNGLYVGVTGVFKAIGLKQMVGWQRVCDLGQFGALSIFFQRLSHWQETSVWYGL